MSPPLVWENGFVHVLDDVDDALKIGHAELAGDAFLDERGARRGRVAELLNRQQLVVRDGVHGLEEREERFQASIVLRQTVPGEHVDQKLGGYGAVSIQVQGIEDLVAVVRYVVVLHRGTGDYGEIGR